MLLSTARKNHPLRLLVLLSSLCFLISSPTLAEDIPPPPTLSDDNVPSSVPSPDDHKEVTIIQKKDAVVEEVRIDGKLRYAKITPTVGKPYYMYDSDGDGVLDATENDIKKANVNQWILMEW